MHGRDFWADLIDGWTVPGRGGVSPAERFLRRVPRSSGDACAEWLGCRFSTGYGQFKWKGSPLGAHRVAWVVANGPVSPGEFVCHRCDNPACVRTDHLWLGSHSDNMVDMHRKLRAPRMDPAKRRRGERVYNAKLTGELVRRIREWSASGVGKCEIARRAGVSRGTVRGVLDGKTWRHVS